MKRILESPGVVWCEKDVTSAGVLVDANDYYKAFYETALTARRSILLSGWQFDSDVELLRGKDAEGATMPVRLKDFLNKLCETRPELHIYILAWDFHVVFALEREWIQKMVFHWTTHERLRFRFDSSHVEKGCHHQKFAVIDGSLSFLGGLDLCDHRWDTPHHRDEDDLRISRGEPHKPFHDIQTYLVGTEVGGVLEDLFRCRWDLAGGDPFELPPALPPGIDLEATPPRGAHVVPAKRVALSRTDPKGSPSKSPEAACACHEVNDLYCAAIDAADEHIYVETQYFSAAKISEAIVKRLRAPGRPAIDIVLVLNMRAETLKEEIAVGLAQAKVLDDLRKAAEGTPHRLGIYYTVPARTDGKEPERATYIHAKLMIVDDLFLDVGSANLTNRSGSVDTELNASFEAKAPGDELAKSICRLRLRLVAEHLGEERELSLEDARVASLDARAQSRDGRLRMHPSPTPGEKKVLQVIDPQALPFDPHGVEEDDDESRSLFAHGIGAVFRVFSNRDDRK